MRKLQITAPAGTNVGQSVQLGVFISTGQTTSANGVQSGNNNLQSSRFSILYRLDGDSAACLQTSSSSNPISKSVNNLNINLESIGAQAFVFRARGDVTPNDVTVTLYSPSGAQLARSQPISVVENHQNPTSFTVYTLNFSDNTKWTSSSSFTGTVGAIELSWAEPANLQFAINFVEFLFNPTTSVAATVFLDCGCNGYNQASGDRLLAGYAVTLTVSGNACPVIRETQSTNSNGAVSFAALPLGCSYSLSIASQDLCWYSASSQLVAAGGTATFAIDASLLDSSALVIPPDTTVSCLADTSPATTGYATLCGASLTFADTVTKKECSGPGGLLAIIKRAWSYESHIRTQTINVVDSKTIIFTSVPASTTVPCNQSPPPSQANATSCTAVTITSSESSAAVSCDSSTCSPRRYLVRTFTATDLCGNTASRTQTFTAACGSAWKSQPAPPPVCSCPPSPPPNCRIVCDDEDVA